VRAVDARIVANTAQLAEVVKTTGSTLTTVDGIGPVLASRILGRTRRPSRFATGSQFASYTGTAPIEVSSGERARHRLSRGGDRQLNAALHLPAVTQARMRGSAGRAYYDRKITEGKTHHEALRCLKRKLAEHLWHIMIRDAKRRHEQTTGPGGHPGATLQSSATGPTPTASSSDKSLPGPADKQPTTAGNPPA
jgi:transposase